MGKYICVNDAIVTTWMVLDGLGYRRKENPQLSKTVTETFETAPQADVQPVKHGRWDEESPDYLDGDSVYVCSVCGETWTLLEGTPLDNNMHFCPNCGAKMDAEKEK